MTANQPQSLNVYPKKKDGERMRSFQLDWYERWSWLHWDTTTAGLLCLYCHNVHGLNMLTLSKTEQLSFIKNGFSSWKEATRAFAKHEASNCHKEASYKWLHYTAGQSVAVQLNTQLRRNQEFARHCLLKEFTSLRYLLRQGLAVRGHANDSGNYFQLLQLRAQDDTDLQQWMNRREKWMSHDVQNEQIELMAHAVLRKIIERIKAAEYFALIVDETTDTSVTEQVSICIRIADESFNVHEEFLGLYSTADTTAETLSKIVKDVLVRFNLDLHHCRAQCYDGAAAMSGIHSGVAARLQQEEPKALNIKCLAHSLNLAVQDSTTTNSILSDAIASVQELNTIVRASAKRLAIFQQVQASLAPDAPSLKPLCPTRWTARFGAFQAVDQNLAAILAALTIIADENTGPTAVKARGLLRHIQTFDFIFGLQIALILFDITEGLSRSLQSESLDIGEALNSAELVTNSLQRKRNDFLQVFQKSSDICNSHDIPAAVLPRRRALPRRFDNAGTAHHFDSVEDYYRHVYIDCIDSIMGEIRRFDQPALPVYQAMEDVLVNAAKGDDFTASLLSVTNYFAGDFDSDVLKRQLMNLQDLKIATPTVRCISDTLKANTMLRDQLFSSVTKLLKLYLLLPVTSATAERSFSSLRRLKTYLRSVMLQNRLNHVAILHVHQDVVDSLDLNYVVSDFVKAKTSRRSIFGN
jgi:hypothetical protein